MRGIKKSNEYARLVSDIDAPKAVWVAIAVSLANRLNEGMFFGVEQILMDEWRALHDNGIVSQKPRRR